MKRIAIYIFAMLMSIGCYDVVFEPIFDGYEELDGYKPYDRDAIPSEGDTCWFYQDLQRVIVKAFDASEAVKAFRWEVHIDGEKYGKTVISRDYDTGSLFTIDEARLWWKERIGTDWGYNTIFFEVPANDTSNERVVEIMVSINESFYEVSEDWGDWFSVFKEVQKGR
jgi:hypothetical protein